MCVKKENSNSFRNAFLKFLFLRIYFLESMSVPNCFIKHINGRSLYHSHFKSHFSINLHHDRSLHLGKLWEAWVSLSLDAWAWRWAFGAPLGKLVSVGTGLWISPVMLSSQILACRCSILHGGNSGSHSMHNCHKTCYVNNKHCYLKIE